MSVAIAAAIARWNNCTLHEGFVNPCIVAGRDIGGTLYSMSVLGWFMVATVPIGALALVGWTTAWIIWSVARRRRGG